MNWKDLAGTVGKAAPILGTLLGGPGGAAVGALVASAIGAEPSPGAVDAALSSPDALLKLRELEVTRALRLQELAVQAAAVEIQAAAADRADARKLQAATSSRMPAVLSLLITAGFFGSLAYLLHFGKPEQGGDALMIMLGALGTAWSGVTAFYFGTTSGSQRKTDLLAQSQPLR